MVPFDPAFHVDPHSGLVYFTVSPQIHPVTRYPYKFILKLPCWLPLHTLLCFTASGFPVHDRAVFRKVVWVGN
jgi:hypothetical protein